MSKKKSRKEEPEVHEELEGFDIRINEFGQIIANFEVEKLNRFLNENIDDKKLRGRDSRDEPTDEEE